MRDAIRHAATLVFALAGGVGLAPAPAAAARVASVSPQGEVAQVRQVVVRFDEAMVGFGDPRAAAPVAVACSDPKAARGTQEGGRWLNEREWVFDFARDLPPGVRCTLQARAGLASAKGEALAGATSWRFHTGGPFVQAIHPHQGSSIDEEQYFALRLNGDATPTSLTANVWCAAEGLGERVPVRLVDGPARTGLLKSVGLTELAAAEPLRVATLSCNRRLTPDSKLQLVYGRGVSTPSGVANATERRFDFKVREAFDVGFGCERENAQAACLPMRPIRVTFNAPVPRKLAEGIRLVAEAGRATLKPQFDDGADELVEGVSFGPSLPEQARLRLELPRGFVDASGRAPRNAAQFPLAVATGPYPPLAKFAAAPFGIVERLADPHGPALLPVTLRHVEADLAVRGLQPGVVSTLKAGSDAEIIAWLRKVNRYDHGHISRAQARRDGVRDLPKPLRERPETQGAVEARTVSLLAGVQGVKTLALPKPSGPDPRPLEVVGIPLGPGLHVVEIASPRLGASLLDPDYGAARTMHVRTAALVTNLAVHFKRGRENAVAFVTTLDRAKPVAGAAVQVSDCRGKPHASGVTDARGLVELKGLPARAPFCSGRQGSDGEDGDGDDPRQAGGDGDRDGAWFVSARAQDAQGVQDLTFTWSDWQRGIEPWRFDLPTQRDAAPSLRAHTILDRSLLRAGETVSMKHLLRRETGAGFDIPDEAARPVELLVTHVGSGQSFRQKLGWRRTPSGGLSAENQWAIPATARLGLYRIELQGGSGGGFETGDFRVEEFRLPLLKGQVRVAGPRAEAGLVQATEVTVAVQVEHVGGGPAANLPVRVSALLRERPVQFAGYEGFSFAPPRGREATAAEADGDAGDDDDGQRGAESQRLVADKLPLTLDRQGAGTVQLKDLPRLAEPRQLLLEAQYADPNGEVQTLRSTTTLWPAAVIAGIRTEGWVSVGGAGAQTVKFQALALDLAGKPLAGVPIDVIARQRITTSSRKRMVGGFYTYDNRTEEKDLGRVCSGRSDARGLLLCEAQLKEAGEIELVAQARDPQARVAQAARSVWVTRRGELWFGGGESDRIDVLPEKLSYARGETARFQVRMPFRQATALVAVEREGVLATQVVQLEGQDPTVSVKIDPAWGPNVYVSVLALRGRLHEVPWYSFFTWGWKAPRAWWTAFRHEGRDFVAPTALVDLSKPAWRFGVGSIRVGTAANRLAVEVRSDKPSHPVRGTARVTVRVKLPDGKPAAGAEVALAAVDQALLELRPNASWNLLDAMMSLRGWGVETSTAQMEVIGRRHFGRKAVPAGGDGGAGRATRELFDTLLLWRPALVLDAKGEATVDVPLNDSLTSFQIVAVADAAAGLFGTGSTTIRATQDLQIASGLPPLVREGDTFAAMLTLRNATAQPMKVEVTPSATALTLAPQTVDLPAGASRELTWPVAVPLPSGSARQEALRWEVQARDTLSGARDAIRLTQRVLPAVPLTVQQAALRQLDPAFAVDVGVPGEALPASGRKLGGVRLALQPRLADGLPGLRDWWTRYPYSCLEQQVGKAIGLRDVELWRKLGSQMPGYLDADGLAHYFPPRDGDVHGGSDTLTAHLLSVTQEAARSDPTWALPEAVRMSMTQGLVAFVEGRIQRDGWAPRKDLDVRKLAAIEALSRHGSARAAMLQSITIAPNQWPTHALLDWIGILQRVKDVPRREESLAQAQQILRARLSWQGTRVLFSTEREDHWWWLMADGDVNTARLMLALMDDAGWRDDMGRLALGFIQRQQGGAWGTTTANVWGGLALGRFSKTFESTPVTGATQASLGAEHASVDWAAAPATAASAPTPRMNLTWPESGRGRLEVTHQGSGRPWLTLQSMAAVPLKAPFSAGYQIRRSVEPVEQATAGRLGRGDVLRVTLEVEASADMSWVAVTDPVPAGATILGSGLGRDSEIATAGERRQGDAWPAFEERSFEAFRAYYAFLPKGKVRLQYTLRLNSSGRFALPPTRVEALYAPEMFGEAPNAAVEVGAAK